MNKVNDSKSSFPSISFEDLLGSVRICVCHFALLADTVLKNLQAAFFTSFVVDLEWLVKKLPPKVPFTVAKHFDKSQDKVSDIQA